MSNLKGRKLKDAEWIENYYNTVLHSPLCSLSCQLKHAYQDIFYIFPLNIPLCSMAWPKKTWDLNYKESQAEGIMERKYFDKQYSLLENLEKELEIIRSPTYSEGSI